MAGAGSPKVDTWKEWDSNALTGSSMELTGSRTKGVAQTHPLQSYLGCPGAKTFSQESSTSFTWKSTWLYPKLHKNMFLKPHTWCFVLQILQTFDFFGLDYRAFLSPRPSKAVWLVQLSPNECFQYIKMRGLFSLMSLKPNQKPDALYQQWSWSLRPCLLVARKEVGKS